MPTFDLSDAAANLSRLVEAVESGAETEIIIACDGKPAARLVPMSPEADASRRIGLVDGKYPSFSLEDFDAHNEDIAARFRGEIA